MQRYRSYSGCPNESLTPKPFDPMAPWLAYGGSPKLGACGQTISKRHITACLNLHARLSVGSQQADPLSFLLDRPPRQPTSHAITRKWRRY
ncbi:hypothetical protein [Absidia glauca]|uniref:Uncharacterized protein n=1 Tax=Absidia glauca TaxID=4829 RepID=A0A163JSE8_ABSGL|nr:hypothetical protein [Absidia glauca]